MKINENQIRKIVRKHLLVENVSLIQDTLSDIKTGYKALKSPEKKRLKALLGSLTIAYKHMPNTKNPDDGEYAVIVLQTNVNTIISKLKSETKTFKGEDKIYRDKLSTSLEQLNNKVIKFRDVGISTIHNGVRVQANVILLMFSGLISSAKIVDKAEELKPKYASVRADGKTIKRSNYGDTITIDPKLPDAKKTTKSSGQASSKKKAPQKRKTSSLEFAVSDEVKAIQKTVGAPSAKTKKGADGKWGKNTSAAFA